MSRVLLPIRRALLAALITVTLAQASGAKAQVERVQAGHKALVGLGILGAELGFVVPTSFGLTKTWSLITFPLVGAAGGAVGGYFLDRVDSRAASVTTLVLGLAFAVPTAILTVGNTRYSTSDLEHDTQALQLQLQMQTRLMAGDGLFRRVDGRFRVAMPGLQVGPAMRLDAASGSMRPVGTQVGLTLVSGAF